MEFTKWEMLMTAEVAMMRTGVDRAKVAEVLQEIEQITGEIDRGTETRIKARLGNQDENNQPSIDKETVESLLDVLRRCERFIDGGPAPELTEDVRRAIEILED